MYDWAKELNCAVTVCDTDCNIIYMNDKSKATFQKAESLIGKNLKQCHKSSSWDKIQSLLKDGGTNVYTISKGEVKKMIYQTVWYENGKIGGLVELSMLIPEEMPHFVR